MKEWLDIAEEFDNKWNFPHCLSAIDGKHIIIQVPSRSGSTFFSYKKSFSIVLLAVCILITSSHLLIMVKLAVKVMEVSTTTVN